MCLLLSRGCPGGWLLFACTRIQSEFYEFYESSALPEHLVQLFVCRPCSCPPGWYPLCIQLSLGVGGVNGRLSTSPVWGGWGWVRVQDPFCSRAPASYLCAQQLQCSSHSIHLGWKMEWQPHLDESGKENGIGPGGVQWHPAVDLLEAAGFYNNLAGRPSSRGHSGKQEVFAIYLQSLLNCWVCLHKRAGGRKSKKKKTLIETDGGIWILSNLS